MILRERGFADARRTPQNDRTELIALDLHAQRLARSQDVLLADEFLERVRTHALGERALARRPSGSPADPVRTGSSVRTGGEGAMDDQGIV